MESKQKYTITELKLENPRIKPQRDVDSVYTKVKKNTPINKIALILFSKLFVSSRTPVIKGNISFTNGIRTYTRTVTRFVLKSEEVFKNTGKKYNVVLTVD